jgi:hypothetical protein
MNKNKGSIIIEFLGSNVPRYESMLQYALQVLHQRNISVSVEKKPDDEGRCIIIDVKDIGTIDHEDMTAFLNALFSRKFEKLTFADGVTVTLRHDEKKFRLPDKIDECKDWFHIE